MADLMAASAGLLQQATQQLPLRQPDGDQGDDGDGNKRKRTSDGVAQRAKRSRYISLACNECKRRKIKCNGEAPCQRCGNMNLDCVYAPNCCANGFKDSNEYRQMAQHALHQQERMDILETHLHAVTENLTSLRRTLGHQLPLPDLYQSVQGLQVPQASMLAGTSDMTHSGSQQGYRGLTGSAYNYGGGDQEPLNEIGLAQNSLEAMGEQHADQTGETSPRIDPAILQDAKDPIWSYSGEEALRFCHVFEEEIGTMYPILDAEKLAHATRKFYSFVEAGTKAALFRNDLPGTNNMYTEDVDILKLVMANAMLCQGNGQSEEARKLFQSVLRSGEQRMDGKTTIQAIRISTLTAIFHFLSDNENLAWRVIGFAARLCVELGLHRGSTYKTFGPSKLEANMLFWCVYVLDRRWSFGTGLPFALPNDTIDPDLGKPVEQSPYLSAMISLTDIGSNVWKAVDLFKSSEDHKQSAEQMHALDFDLTKWYSNLPLSLQYNTAAHDPTIAPADRSVYRLQLLLYLRRNQMQIMIYRPVLHSANLGSYLTEAQSVVDIAKDTISLLAYINQTSDIYQTQQITFNHFLVSALGVLFLAAANSPAQFAENCRHEFHQALELVRGLSADSFVSKRLWTTIKGLKNVAPKMGLLADSEPVGNLSLEGASSGEQVQYVDAHSSAALGLAGLAGHSMDENAYLAAQLSGHGQANDQGNAPGATASPNPNGMANDLVNLYESGDLGVGLSWITEEQVGRLMEMF